MRCSGSIRWAVPFALIGLVAWPTAAASQDGWEQSSPYYEDDAWYDISEWLDGNDYNPTDERYGAWDDESHDSNIASYDADDDESNYGEYGEQTYGSGANGSGNSGESYYQSSNQDDIYDYAAFFYDTDDDGVSDAMTSYYDRDDDGMYDSVNVYTFGRSSQGQQADRSQSSKREQATSSRQRRVQGKVAEKRTKTVQGEEHLVVAVRKQNDDKKYLVDLGRKDKLRGVKISKDTQISARGPVVKQNNRQILLAQQVEVDGQRHQIDRSRKKVSGKVDDTRTVKVRGSKHQLAILSTKDGTKYAVDLGPKNRLQMDLQQDDQLTVKGAPLKVNDRLILMAFQVQKDGEWTKIDRRDSQSQQSRQQAGSDRQARGEQQQGRQGRTLRGDVVETRTITVRGNKHQAAVVKSDAGNRVLVDLGPKDQLKLDIRKGDQLTVRGPQIRADDQRVVVATSVRQNDQRTQIRSLDGSDGQNRRSIRGKIQETRNVTVRGEERTLVKVKTDEGNTVLVDLGRADSLSANLTKGDEITARGAPAKAGDQRVLVALEVTTAGGNTIPIDRQRSGTSRR